MMALAALAAVLGMAVGRSLERLLRRAGGPLGTSAMVDIGLARLRWVAPAVVASLILKAATSTTPSAALVWVPLALVGPWLVAVHGRCLGRCARQVVRPPKPKLATRQSPTCMARSPE